MKTYTAAHWGIYEVEKSSSGHPVLRGLPTDPDPSPIGLSMLEAANDESVRVKRPSIRAGWLNERKRGSSKSMRGIDPFVEVSWEDAIDLVTEELTRVKEEFGNGSIFGGSYGWSSAGRFHHAQSQVHRFLNILGGYVASRDTYSLGAGRVILPHIAATIEELMTQHTSWDSLIEHTELLVCFGGASSKNAQVSAGGPGQHLVSTSLRRMSGKGIQMVNVSPTRDDLDPGGDFEWIPIKPNTDTAFMLALAHCIYVGGNHDQEFLDRYTVGFDVFKSYLIGQTDGQPKSAEWAAGVCGIQADVITGLARRMLRKRTMLNVAWSLQRADHGEQPFWMVITLAAMLGQIGQPGGGFGVGYGPANTMGNKTAMFPGPTFSQGTNKIKDFIPVARIADMLLNPAGKYQYNGSECVYPDIRLVYWDGGNPFHHHQDLSKLLTAWRQPETVVVHEQYWTSTAKLADIVLPATTSFEREDICYAKRERYMAFMSQLQPPLYESKSDYEIFALMAQKLGVGDLFTEGLDSTAWIERIYEECRHPAALKGVSLPDFEAFKREGLIDLHALKTPEPVVMFEDFRRDPASHPLKTPSGKIEIFSATIDSYKLEDCVGHPCWYPPKEWLDDKAEAAGQFHLITDQPRNKLHSQLDHSRLSRSGKIKDREPVTIHIEDARKLNLRDGDIVRVFNARGGCLAAVVCTEEIRRGVIRISTGSWFDPSQSIDGSLLDVHGNPNVLTRDEGASSLSQGCAAQSCLVSIERYEGELPPVRAFSAPEFAKHQPNVLHGS